MKNVEEKPREKHYSNNRLSDAAYHRNYEYPDKRSSQYSNGKDYLHSTMKNRPSTAKHSYRSSSGIPHKSKL